MIDLAAIRERYARDQESHSRLLAAADRRDLLALVDRLTAMLREFDTAYWWDVAAEHSGGPECPWIAARALLAEIEGRTE